MKELRDAEKVPLFRKWWHWYVAVIAVLFALIVLFYFFTVHFD